MWACLQSSGFVSIAVGAGLFAERGLVCRAVGLIAQQWTRACLQSSGIIYYLSPDAR